MKKIFRLLIVCILFIIMVGCGEDNENELRVPASSSNYEGENYQEVINDLQNAGFTNINTIVLDDLITGWITKDGEVEQVEIDGNSDFSKSTSYPKDVKIVITYHTFPNHEESSISPTSSPTSSTDAVENINHNDDAATEQTLAQKDGYNEETNKIIVVGKYAFSVPKYYVDSINQDEYYQAYAETGEKTVMLSITGSTDEEDDVNFDILYEEREETITSFLNAFDEGRCLSSEIFETDFIKGILYKFTFSIEDYTGTGILLTYPSEEDNKWYSVSLLNTDNTEFDYDDDLIKVIKSIKETDELFPGYTLLNVDGGDISGSRQPNVVVDIGYGDREYYAFTNEYGQLVKVIAKEIILQDDNTEPVTSDGRYYKDEAKVPGTEREDMDEGHIIADSLGGVSNAYNITPQDSTMNRYGDQAYMEKVIRDAGGCTEFEALITYPDNQTQIPSHYHYTYTLNGNVITEDFDNVNPDGVNQNLAEAQSKPGKTDEHSISSIDSNGNGKVTIAEAKSAGYQMPITKDHWLYQYMDDRDGDGLVGE